MEKEEFVVCPDYMEKCFLVQGYVVSLSEYEQVKSQLTGICIEFIDEVGEDYVIVNLSCDERQPHLGYSDNIFLKIYGEKEELDRLTS